VGYSRVIIVVLTAVGGRGTLGAGYGVSIGFGVSVGGGSIYYSTRLAHLPCVDALTVA
jgi:hypothetical protein